MLIGILGAGEVALAFSRYALRAGHQVRLSNSRGPESLKDVVKELGTAASAGTIREAAQAPIVLIAIPWPKVEEVAATILFLASPENKVTRGAVVPVYGRS